jgi:methylamine utilization protein MauE
VTGLVPAAVALGAKAVLAVLLIVAGGAKLADLHGFASAVTMLAPRRLAVTRSWPGAARALALGVAAGELVLGGVSLAWPALGGVNLAVLGAGAGFVAVSAAGYAFRRGRSCRCFGALSRRTFDRAGLARAAGIAVVAALAATTAPATAAAVALTPASSGLLGGAAAALAAVAFTAARSLAAVAAGRGA